MCEIIKTIRIRYEIVPKTEFSSGNINVMLPKTEYIY